MADTGDVTFPLIDLTGFASLVPWEGMSFPKIQFQALAGLGELNIGIVTFPMLVFVTDVGVGVDTFPLMQMWGNAFVDLQAGSGLYKVDVNRTHDTHYNTVATGATANAKIPDPFIQTYLTHDEDESYIHVHSYRIRVLGSGNLHATLYTLNSVRSQPLTDIVLTPTSAREQTVLSNFISQRVMLRLQTNVIDNTFDITRVILFLKTLWTQKPQ
jgi:hypothetical protein